MTEYRIEILSKLETVKKIWKQFLKDDSTWHFTLEGSYIELRVDADHKSKKWVRDFENYLLKNKWSYIKFPYIDNIPMTRKYQKQFEKIFHGYSELAMILPKKTSNKTLQEAATNGSDFSGVAERAIHLFYNINGFDVNAESYHLAQTLVGRAYTAGWYSAKLEEQQVKEGSKKNVRKS